MSAVQRRTAAAFACAACATALAVPAAAGRGQPGPARAARAGASSAGGHVQVIEVEYRLMLSRGAVRAGAVGLEAIDRGQDPHDLRLQRIGSGNLLIGPELSPGRRWDATVHLRPGTYRLWCSLPEHARLGMRATLHVVR